MSFASNAIEKLGHFITSKATILGFAGTMMLGGILSSNDVSAQQKPGMRIVPKSQKDTLTGHYEKISDTTKKLVIHDPATPEKEIKAKNDKKSKHGLGFFIAGTGGAQGYYPGPTRPGGIAFGVIDRGTKLFNIGVRANTNLGGEPDWGYSYQFSGFGNSASGSGAYYNSEIEITGGINPLRVKVGKKDEEKMQFNAGVFAGMRGNGWAAGTLNLMGPMAGARVMIQTLESHKKVGFFAEARAGIKQYNQWDQWFNFNADYMTKPRISTPFFQVTAGIILPTGHRQAKNTAF